MAVSPEYYGPRAGSDRRANEQRAHSGGTGPRRGVRSDCYAGRRRHRRRSPRDSPRDVARRRRRSSRIDGGAGFSGGSSQVRRGRTRRPRETSSSAIDTETTVRNLPPSTCAPPSSARNSERARVPQRADHRPARYICEGLNRSGTDQVAVPVRSDEARLAGVLRCHPRDLLVTAAFAGDHRRDGRHAGTGPRGPLSGSGRTRPATARTTTSNGTATTTCRTASHAANTDCSSVPWLSIRTRPDRARRETAGEGLPAPVPPTRVAIAGGMEGMTETFGEARVRLATDITERTSVLEALSADFRKLLYETDDALDDPWARGSSMDSWR